MTRASLIVSLLVSCWLMGCAETRQRADTGTESDATLDAARDAPPDAPCACDDGIACTIDSCDREGRCVHWSDCPGSDVCVMREGEGVCERALTCASGGGECLALPCNRSVGCMRGRCRYDWTTDQDQDGVTDDTCGGTDCAPYERSIPGVEVSCNGRDDDCNGVVDETASLATDPLNCGACNTQCVNVRRNFCVDGACVCRPGSTLCDDACVDIEGNPLHCGGCGRSCVVGACDAGRCAYPETLRVSFDVALTYPTFLSFAPNGDVLVFVQGRPARVAYTDGRPAQSIPAGESDFEGHAIRLDRTGNFLGITSLPHLLAYDSAGLHVIAMTNEGFYFAGAPRFAGEYFGTTYGARQELGMIGYVPRSGEVAWVRAEPDLFGVLVTRGGNAVAGIADSYLSRLLRYSVTGTLLPNDPRLDALVELHSVAPRGDEGFLAMVWGGPGNLGPGVPTSSGGGSYMLLFDEEGVPVEEIGLELAEVQVIDARADGRSWLTQQYGDLAEVTRRGTSMVVPYGVRGSAYFDGAGLTVLGYSGSSSELRRFRDGVELASVVLPGDAALARGTLWSFTSTAGETTLSRIELPPLP